MRPREAGQAHRPMPGAWSAIAGAGSSAWRRSAGPARPTRLQPRLATCLELADQVVVASPADVEAQRLRGWLAEIQGFVTLFDRALRALSRAETDEIARGFTVLSRISDETLDRLLRLLGSLPEEELAETLEAVGAHLAGHRAPRHARRQPHRTPGPLRHGLWRP